MFSNEELKIIRALCNKELKKYGLDAVNTLVPLAAKCEKAMHELQVSKVLEDSKAKEALAKLEASQKAAGTAAATADTETADPPERSEQ